MHIHAEHGSIAAGPGSVIVQRSGRETRWKPTRTIEKMGELAEAVLVAERAARSQLLGEHHAAIDLHFAFRRAPGHDTSGADPDGHLNGVVDYYRRLRPRRMVITGEPGSGKTVLAVQLILDLLKYRGPGDPVPVRVSLAAWPGTQTLEDWLIGRLRQTYRLRKSDAANLVRGRHILPVLDGLDEMDNDPAPGISSRAAQALHAFNAYQDVDRVADLVLTCRSTTYWALESTVWVDHAAQVELQPVDLGQTRQFLRDHVADRGLARWHGVLNTLARDPDGALTAGLSTPWRLTLAVTVYQQRHPATGEYLRDPDSLLAPELATGQAVGDHLLSLYVPAVLAQYQDRPYTDDHVQAWLSALATYLDENAATQRVVGGLTLSGSDLVLHELWPIGGKALPRIVSAALVAATWVAGAAVVLAQVPAGVPIHKLIGPGSAAAVLAAALSVIHAGFKTWPVPRRVDGRRLRTRAGRRNLVLGLVVAPTLGFAFGKAVGPALGPALGLALGFTGVLASILFTDQWTAGVRDPRDVVRGSLTFGLTFGLAFGLAFGFAFGVATGITWGLPSGLAFGLASWFVFWLAGGMSLGLSWLRYVAMLLCTRYWNNVWLPMRLGRFLQWCYLVGLLRVAGVAYQFRHRELQEYLSRHSPP